MLAPRDGGGKQKVQHGPNEISAWRSDTLVAPDVARAVAKLASLHDGELGLVAAVACGPAAIPALRAVLFSREPSGIFEPRRRAVEALAALHAYDVLVEYLATPHEIVDPREATGEEAVINAAARALAEWPDGMVVPLLLSLTYRPPLAGVVDALGKLRCAAAIPYFVKALDDDFTRPAAEAALRHLGPLAAPALLEAATLRLPSEEHESVSSQRRRASALGVLAERRLASEGLGPALSSLTQDRDATVAALACGIVLADVGRPDRIAAVRRLIDLLPSVHWLLGAEIEDRLVEHFDLARDSIAEALRCAEPVAASASEPSRLVRTLRRVEARAAARRG